MKKEITAAEAEARLAKEHERLLARLKKVNAEKESIEKKLERYKMFAISKGNAKYDLKAIKRGEPFAVRERQYFYNKSAEDTLAGNWIAFKLTHGTAHKYYDVAIDPSGELYGTGSEINKNDISELAKSLNLTTKELYDALKK